jgi:hypothetical protein
LLGAPLAAQRPEARAASAGENDRIKVIGQYDPSCLPPRFSPQRHREHRKI